MINALLPPSHEQGDMLSPRTPTPEHVTMINALTPSPEQVDAFRRDGALRLPGLLPDPTLHMLRSRLRDATREPGAHRNLFARVAYDFANEDHSLRTMLQSPVLGSILSALTGRSLFFTQTIAFDLHQGDSGFGWHLGFISFKYIRTTDFGYTLWIPLEPVSTRGQHGGLVYAPRSVVDGHAKARLAGHILDQPDWQQRLRELASPPGETELLERSKVEHDFALGDALLFDRFVYHRSEALGPGPLTHRPAFVLRFVDADARISRNVLDRKFPREERAPSQFRWMFADTPDNEPIASYADRLIAVGPRA